MIPTLILFGLVFGRFWRLSLVVAAVGWPLLLVADHTIALEWDLVGVAGLAVLNTVVGVLVHQGLLFSFRQFQLHVRWPPQDCRSHALLSGCRCRTSRSRS